MIAPRAVTPKTADAAEMAALLGCSKTQLYRKVRARAVPRRRDGLFNVVAVMHAWNEVTDPAHGRSINQPTVNSKALAAARLGFEQARTQKMQLENEHRMGLWVRRDEVARELFEMARTVRERILGIPDRVSSLVSGMDRAEAHRLLTAELRLALEDLSSDEPKRA